MFADAIISSLGYLWWNFCCGERRSRRLLDRERLALHARFALAFAFLKNTKEKVCFASYGKYAVYLTSCCLIFPVFEYFRRSDLAQPPGFRMPRRFVVSAVSSFGSQAYFWEKWRPEIPMCLQAGRLHDRTVDLPTCPILFREKLRIYMQESWSLSLRKQQETLSTYTEQIRNWNELRSVKVTLRDKVKCGGVATYAPALQTINHWKCLRCWHGEAAKSP